MSLFDKLGERPEGRPSRKRFIAEEHKLKLPVEHAREAEMRYYWNTVEKYHSDLGKLVEINRPSTAYREERPPSKLLERTQELLYKDHIHLLQQGRASEVPTWKNDCYTEKRLGKALTEEGLRKKQETVLRSDGVAGVLRAESEAQQLPSGSGAAAAGSDAGHSSRAARLQSSVFSTDSTVVARKALTQLGGETGARRRYMQAVASSIDVLGSPGHTAQLLLGGGGATGAAAGSGSVSSPAGSIRPGTAPAGGAAAGPSRSAARGGVGAVPTGPPPFFAPPSETFRTTARSHFTEEPHLQRKQELAAEAAAAAARLAAGEAPAWMHPERFQVKPESRRGAGNAASSSYIFNSALAKESIFHSEGKGKAAAAGGGTAGSAGGATGGKGDGRSPEKPQGRKLVQAGGGNRSTNFLTWD